MGAQPMMLTSEAGNAPTRLEALTPTQAVPLLRARDVTLQYKTSDHEVTATQGVSFDVYAGDRFILLGPSGCGKSSLLKSTWRLSPAASSSPANP